MHSGNLMIWIDTLVQKQLAPIFPDNLVKSDNEAA